VRKQLRYITFYLQTFLGRHLVQLILSALIGFFATVLIIQIYPLYKRIFVREHRVIGYVGRFSPRTLPLFIQQQISVGLTTADEQGLPNPGAAQSWEFDEQGSTLTVHLKNNLLFHDGKPFTASDVNYKIKGVTFTVVDDATLSVQLKEPFSPILTLLSQPILRSSLVGLGSYKVTKLSVEEDTISVLILTPVVEGAPSLTYRFYRNLKDAILAYKMGEVSILKDIADQEQMKSWEKGTFSESTLFDRYVGIFFNMSNPAFKDKEIRQALAYAIPEFENFQKAHTPLSPLSWAYSDKIRLYDFDAQTAIKILSKSELASSSSELILSTFATNLFHAEKIAESWGKVGVKTKVKVETSLNPVYQVFLLTQQIPSDPDQYHIWQSTQIGTNITNYGSPKIDKLLEDGRKTYDFEERKRIYADFQRYLVDDAPVIFLYYPKVYTVERQ